MCAILTRLTRAVLAGAGLLPILSARVALALGAGNVADGRPLSFWTRRSARWGALGWVTVIHDMSRRSTLLA